MKKSICFLCIMAAPAFAQEWATRAGDQLFTLDELTGRLSGQTLTFYDNGRSQFGPNGGYSYTYDFGGVAYGVYQIGDDSTVCIRFENGASRCDLYVTNAARLIVVTQDGMRFPVRPDDP